MNETTARRWMVKRHQGDTLLIRTLIDQIPDFVYVKDIRHRFVVANQAVAGAYGLTPADLLGKTDFDFHPPQCAQAFFEEERRVIGAGHISKTLETFSDSTGKQQWYSTTQIPLRDRSDAIIGLLGIGREVTARHQADVFRQQESEILALIAQNAPLSLVLDRLALLVEASLENIRASILLVDADMGLLRLGAAPSLAPDYAGLLAGMAIGPQATASGMAALRGDSVVVADVLSDPHWASLLDKARSLGIRSVWSTPVMAHDGTALGILDLYSAAVRRPGESELRLINAAVRLAGIAIQRQLYEERIRFIGQHDALTGLPNRNRLTENLGQALRTADRLHGTISVVFIDLDNFKWINDGLGHIAGDKLLKIAAGRMLSCLRAGDSVVRLGGDEFVLILTDAHEDRDGVVALLDRIRQSLWAPADVEGRLLQLTCSMGVAVFPKDGTQPETMLRNADAAMYDAKRSGRDRLRFYTPAMGEKLLGRLQMQDQLRHAIERNELSLVYQPQFDLRSGLIFGVEALVRWTHPTLGKVCPAQFIPIAEESGLVVSIGDWVLRQACRDNKAWQDAGADPVGVAVNVSAVQFRERGWADRIVATLRETALAAQWLELELTESMLMDDVARAVDTMQHLTNLGICLSIDDFGTGYSNLYALKNFPVRRLKIDQSFVRDLATDANDRAITATVIALGQNLGLRVIAEGVETEAQLTFLLQSGCDELQGFLYSKPLPAPEIERLLRAQSGAARRRGLAVAARASALASDPKRVGTARRRTTPAGPAAPGGVPRSDSRDDAVTRPAAHAVDAAGATITRRIGAALP